MEVSDQLHAPAALPPGKGPLVPIDSQNIRVIKEDEMGRAWEGWELHTECWFGNHLEHLGVEGGITLRWILGSWLWECGLGSS